jgi:hypothetical protein
MKMGRFYGEVQGSRGKASRVGGVKSGFWGHIRGWNIGVEVDCIVNKEGEDVIQVWKTGGSNDGLHRVLIAQITEEKMQLKG